MKKQIPKRLEIIRMMPPLQHSHPGTRFRIEDSEVVQWLMKQPSVLQYVFDKASDYMRYDPQSGIWRGSDYDD